MSLAKAIETGDLAELPSRRDEDWRWTDLRGLVRSLPPRSPTFVGDLGPGLFDAVAEETVAIVNGENRTTIVLPSGGEPVVAVRYIAAPGAGAHAAAPKLDVDKVRLVILETLEGADGGYLSEIGMTMTIGPEGEVERIILADDAEEAVSVLRWDVTLAPGARFAPPVDVPLAVLSRHVWIMGMTGGNKTVVATSLARQLRMLVPDACLVVADFGGDPVMFHRIREATLAAKKRFRFLSTNPADDWDTFEPLQAVTPLTDVGIVKAASLLVSSLSLDYGDGFGKDYHTFDANATIDPMIALIRLTPTIPPMPLPLDAVVRCGSAQAESRQKNGDWEQCRPRDPRTHRNPSEVAVSPRRRCRKSPRCWYRHRCLHRW